MKKFLPYILILVVLFGIFSPISKVKAAEGCFVVDSTGKVSLHPTQKTEAGCKLVFTATNPWTWGTIPTGTGAALPTSVSAPSSNLPACILDDGDNVVNSPCAMNGTMVTVNPVTGSVNSVATAPANNVEQKELNCTLFGSFWDCVNSVLARLAYLVMSIAAFILWLAGTILNFVLDTTILNMAQNLKSMTGINIAWKIIRDLMNIAFIFLLVYEGIRIIIGMSDTGKVKTFISGVVLASILINFSLFFTKVLIDASNIVTIGIYNSIIDTSSNPTAVVAGPQGGSGDVYQSVSGLSVPFMNSLGLTNFYSSASFADISANVGGGTNMLIFFIMGTVIFIIVSFVFFAVSAMFVVRYVTLLVLLMLSPIAYMGMALPQMKSYASEWWKSLNGQLIFAPVYMIMTLVILTLMQSPNFLTKGEWGKITSVGDAGSINLIFNFVIVIGLIIGSLIISKKTSSEGSNYIGKATGNLTKFAGNAVMGGGGALGRNSFGWAGKKFADNASLQEAAAGKNGRAVGTLARLGLYASKTARSATFDVRNASVPTSVAGDLIEGTVGRTTLGKAIGLNDVNIPSIPVGAPISNMAGTGTGGKNGFIENKEESAKRVRAKEAAAASELKEVQAKKAVLDGRNAIAGTVAGDAAIAAMEKALAGLSTKETETLVASNRELLESQNFANKISVQQLEAINKSDQFSEAEKKKIKDSRFSVINDPANLAALAVPQPLRTPDQEIAAKKISSAIKNLKDAELEMIDPAYLSNQHFVAQLKPGQIEAVNKSSRFTTQQQDQLRKARLQPLQDAFNSTAPTRVADIQKIVRRADYKTLAGLMNIDIEGTTPPQKIGLDPAVVQVYTVNMLKRMANEMNPSDITTLRNEILFFGDPATIAWLNDPNEGGRDFA